MAPAKCAETVAFDDFCPEAIDHVRNWRMLHAGDYINHDSWLSSVVVAYSNSNPLNSRLGHKSLRVCFIDNGGVVNVRGRGARRGQSRVDDAGAHAVNCRWD